MPDPVLNKFSADSDTIVPCHYCRAKIGEWCYVNGPLNNGTAQCLHKVRRDDAKRFRERREVRSSQGWRKVMSGREFLDAAKTYDGASVFTDEAELMAVVESGVLSRAEIAQIAR